MKIREDYRNTYQKLLANMQEKFKDAPDVVNKIEASFNEVCFKAPEPIELITSIHQLVFYFCEIFAISPNDLKFSPSKQKLKTKWNMVLLRQLFCYQAKKLFGKKYSLQQIADCCSSKQDHTFTSHNTKLFNQLIQVKDEKVINVLSLFDEGIKKYEENLKL